MSDNKNSYKKIFKTTSLFGTVHFINMVISVIRSKFLAVFIGAEGYGIYSLLNSTIELIRKAIGLNIETSGVKKIAQANAEGELQNISVQANILLWIAVITGGIGSFFAIVFSNQLSVWTFGDYGKAVAIGWIGITILIKQLTSAKTAIMQGMAKLNFLAKSSLYGNIIALLINLPLFYFFRLDSIVPAIIIASLLNYLCSFFFFRKINIKVTLYKPKKIFTEGKEVMLFGTLLSLSAFLPVLVNYLIQVFIRYKGDLNSVGLFSVGMVVINAYVGIIFTAMSTEYYPRLASFNKDKNLESEALNQQAIVSLLIIGPVIVLFLFFKEYIIHFLFSEKFVAVLPMLKWAILAMLFKAVSWSMGYIIIARADSKVFTKTAIGYNTLHLLLCVGGYFLDGLHGLGVGFCLFYIFHLIGNYLLIFFRYKITLSIPLLKIFVITFILCSLSFLFSDIEHLVYKYLSFIVLFSLITYYSWIEINKRVDAVGFISKFTKRKRNNKDD